MGDEPPFHQRRTLRLRGYDYAQHGAYFVTVVTHDRVNLFGDVVDGEMRLHDAGLSVRDEWNALPGRFPRVQLDGFVVMPNHVHGIVIITTPLVPAVDPTIRAQPATTGVAPTLGEIVGAFKSLTTLRYVRAVRSSGWPAFSTRLWQRNYYEHVIRSNECLNQLRQYIIENPVRWAMDPDNPQRKTARVGPTR